MTKKDLFQKFSIGKHLKIYLFNQMNKLKEKNHKIKSVNAEKKPNNITQSIHIPSKVFYLELELIRIN